MATPYEPKAASSSSSGGDISYLTSHSNTMFKAVKVCLFCHHPLSYKCIYAIETDKLI